MDADQHTYNIMKLKRLAYMGTYRHKIKIFMDYEVPEWMQINTLITS